MLILLIIINILTIVTQPNSIKVSYNNLTIKSINMKNLKMYLCLVASVTLFLVSCADDDDASNPITPPTSQEFSSIKEVALENLTQTFDLTIDNTGSITFTSENGVVGTIYSSCLEIGGLPVTGEVTVEFVELFDRGNMLLTNKPTMGKHLDGTLEMLVSGGAFYVNVSQNGVDVDANNCGFNLQIPASLTGGIDNDMTLWYGTIDEDDNIVWENAEETPGQEGGIEFLSETYWAFSSQFGWSNVDRFYSDPRPKTTIYVDAPNGYTPTNCAIFLSYDGEETGLARLDTYDSVTTLFSEHYGLIPIGLECHVIFVSENNGQWVYAIKPYTVVEDGVLTINASDLNTITEAGLAALINDLP